MAHPWASLSLPLSAIFLASVKTILQKQYFKMRHSWGWEGDVSLKGVSAWSQALELENGVAVV